MQDQYNIFQRAFVSLGVMSDEDLDAEESGSENEAYVSIQITPGYDLMNI